MNPTRYEKHLTLIALAAFACAGGLVNAKANDTANAAVKATQSKEAIELG